MVVYNQAFDYYHAIYRMIQLLTHYKRENYVELDRLRIWDYYFLFPEEVHKIRLKENESEVREQRKRFIKQKHNPYTEIFDSKRIFEKIKPYQITALSCLASYGLIDKQLLKENRVSVISADLLKDYSEKFEKPSEKERNIISLMVLYFSTISMFGPDGLKSRTKLLESKYDS